MLLKSLELQGFKTFPDKTLLTFEKGITAVVGPNGSGKSNISDAMRWVLGEQSTRALRCSKMEDVIFSGTPQRKAQGFSEVTITIDNTDRRLNFDGDTVAITRRFYRSGESEYRINKTMVRLRDVHELFMDTGLGAMVTRSSVRVRSTASSPQKVRTGAKSLRRRRASRATGIARRRRSAVCRKPKRISSACAISFLSLRGALSRCAFRPKKRRNSSHLMRKRRSLRSVSGSKR